jgi:formylglycine-generating enzyme required for sulfatase activity
VGRALDLAGNVEEWTASWYGERLYFQLEDGAIDPAGPTTGGCACCAAGPGGKRPISSAHGARPHTPVSHSDTRGFRIILNAPRE